MSQKTFCDWCGEEVGWNCPMTLERATASFAGRGPNKIEMDLCAECSRRLWNMLLAQVPGNVLPEYAKP